MRNVIEINELCKKYQINKGLEKKILHNINLEVSAGEFVSIMGPSGSGKSTLLYNISGMDKISSGCVKFDSNDISTITEKKKARIRLKEMGFVFQNNYLLRNLTILENILLPAYHLNEKKKKVINEKALDLLEQMEIADIANNDITQASGGQLQRVSICRALINNPKIILADEPTGALNSKTSKDIIDIFLRINKKGVSIFLVTHDIKIASNADRIIYIKDGSIVDEKYLGKCFSNFRERENILSKWLFEMGF